MQANRDVVHGGAVKGKYKPGAPLFAAPKDLARCSQYLHLKKNNSIPYTPKNEGGYFGRLIHLFMYLFWKAKEFYDTQKLTGKIKS